MPDPLYTYEKLGEAVQTLATGRGRIKERLTDAVASLVMVDDKVFALEGMAHEAPEYWRRIWGAITAVKFADPKQGSAAASIEGMSEEEAASIAQSIVSLDAMLESFVEDQRGR